MKAWIDLNGNCKTGLFVNNKLDREVDYIDSRMLDFIIPEQPNQSQAYDRIGMKEDGVEL